MIDCLSVIPINEAEAVIVPFWSWAVSDLKNWHFQPGEGSGAVISEPWAQTAFSWSRKPAQGPAWSLTRTASVDCAGYDHVILRAQIPIGVTLRLRVETDLGPRSADFTHDSGRVREFAMPLAGAARLSKMIFELEAGSCPAGSGGLYWLGLASTPMMQRYQERWDRLRNTDWGDQHLKPAGSPFAFKPACGIFLTSDALGQLREAVSTPGAVNPFLTVRETHAASAYRPESDISDFLSTYWEILTRDRDSGRLTRLIGPGSQAALAGLVLKDAGLLRLAARYALSIAACENWIDAFPCTFHGCEFETKYFAAMYAAQEISTILDLAGEAFSYWGKEYLMRRLAEKALGPINYVSWRWDYIHSCNQLALFSPGRVGALLVLENEWPRIKPYTDLAIQELSRCMESVVLPDGSFVEGPGYLIGSLSTAISAFLPYARVRGLPPESVLPPALRRTADYIEAFLSTDDAHDFLATNECGSDVSITSATQAVLPAAALPDSHWVTVYHKALARLPGPPSDLSFWSQAGSIPATGPKRRAFMHLLKGASSARSGSWGASP